MASVILVIHMFLALAIIGLVLLQRSEGGGLGIGGGSGGLGGLATPQGTANILTRATAICAAGFFITSLALGAIAGHSNASSGILNALDSTPAAETTTKAPESGAPKVTPASPEAPAVAPKADDKKDKAAKDEPSPVTDAPKTPTAPTSE